MNKFDTQLLMNPKSKKSDQVFNWFDKKILLIEDDYANYLFFHEILSCSNAFLLRAVSLQEAFDMLSSNIKFDLLIINTGLPGNENCRSIKRMKLLWPDIPIIAIATCECKGKNSHCYHSGCDTMISYNVDSSDVKIAVDEMVNPAD